jgi:hypothetical protein
MSFTLKSRAWFAQQGYIMVYSVIGLALYFKLVYNY